MVMAKTYVSNIGRVFNASNKVVTNNQASTDVFLYFLYCRLHRQMTFFD